MERKQGLFWSLKEEVVRGLSPARSGSFLRRRRKENHVPLPELFVEGTCPSTPARPVEALSPLKEGPEEESSSSRCEQGRWAHWKKGPLATCSSSSDLRLLLGVLGAPLSPFHVCTTDPFPHLAIKDIPIVS